VVGERVRLAGRPPLLYATSDVPLTGERALARRARVPVETAPMMDRDSGMTQVPDDGRAGWSV